MESFCLLSPSQRQVLNILMLLGSWVCVQVVTCHTFHNADTWRELKTKVRQASLLQGSNMLLLSEQDSPILLY